MVGPIIKLNNGSDQSYLRVNLMTIQLANSSYHAKFRNIICLRVFDTFIDFWLIPDHFSLMPVSFLYLAVDSA